MSKDLSRVGSINLLVYLLVILFGISSWVDINGLWVELPILVQNLPEGWDLPSYMSVIIQVANIAPLIYTVASTLCPHRMLEVPVIYVIICLGGVSCLLLAFLWDVTSYIAGREHSTALFVLQFCLALVDCTSSVAFLPFMSAFKPQYMTAYFIGEGFSGLIPSLVALGQGAGNVKCVRIPIYYNESTTNITENSKNITDFGTQHYFVDDIGSLSEYAISDPNKTLPDFNIFQEYQPPRFSVRIFFLQLMLLMIISATSFTLLNFWSYCKKEKVDASSNLSKNLHIEYSDPDVLKSLTRDGHKQVVNSNQKSLSNNSSDTIYSICTQKRSDNKKTTINCFTTKNPSPLQLNYSETVSPTSAVGFLVKPKTRGMSKCKYSLYLFLTVFLNAISNGVLPSIQSYSCLPYGTDQYHLSVTLSSIANPLACLAAFLLAMKSARMTVLMTLLGSGLTGYLVWTASASPTPPLVNYTAGSVILILCWILVVFVNTYTKVSIATEFREEGKRSLMWFGASIQAGSLLGAVAIFVVVTILKLLKPGNLCA